MLLQANDYLWLHDHLGCELQMGGSDQWGNIVSGVDLIRRKRQVAVHALAWPLLTAADGTKLGKTTGARLWLDPAKTSPYQFHQHWMQLDDRELEQQFMVFSLRPLAEIADAARRARRGARAAPRPAGARRRGDGAGPRRRRRRGPPARRPTCCSAAIRSARRRRRWRRWPARCPRAAARPSAARRRRRAARVAPGWPRRRAMPAGSCSRAACGPTACSRGPEQGLDGRAAAPRPLPAAAQGQAVATTSSRFLRTKVDAPAGSSIVLLFALRTGKAAPEQARHQRRSAPSRVAAGACRELRLLENGREDERQCGQRVDRPFGSSDDAVCQFLWPIPTGHKHERSRLCR